MRFSEAPPLSVLALLVVVALLGVCSGTLPNAFADDPAVPDPESELDIPLVWVASSGFSSIQGVNDWSYRFEESPGKLEDLTWNPERYWEAPAKAEGPRISATEQAPATGHPIVRSWLAPYSGTVRVEGRVAMAAEACPEGPTASIRHRDRVRWERALKDGTSASHQETIEVARGDMIGFRVVPGGGRGCATVTWDPRITYLEGPACWRLAWNDEFNDPTLTAPDPAKWRVWDDDKAPCVGCPDLTVSDGEQQDWLIDTWQRADNIVVADGVATLHTRHDGPGRQPFSGGMMDTRGRIEPNGGVAPAVRLEARTLRSAGESVHPAFWTLGGTDAVRAYQWDPTELDAPAAHGRSQTVASREFSPSQGGGNWYYEFVGDDATYRPLDYNAGAKRWENQARARYLRVTRAYQVPDDGFAVARSWQAPHAGRVRVTFEKAELVRDDCGDGARFSIRVGAEEIVDPDDERVEWTRTLKRGGRVGWTSRLISVRKGERVRFRVDPLGDGCDRASWDPTIEYHQWPARGELDIMEHPPGVAASVGAHTPAFNHTLGNAVTRGVRDRAIDPSAWLVSWVDWYPDRLEFFFYESRPGEAGPAEPFVVYDHIDGPDEWPFDRGHYLILHDKIKSTGPNGTERSLPAFPTAFRVDWVRVWEYTCGDSKEPGE